MQDGLPWGSHQQGLADICRRIFSHGEAPNSGPLLVFRDIRRDLPRLLSWGEIEFSDIREKVVGEVEVLCYATGRRPLGPWAVATDDAYDALMTESHWRKEAPPYYTAVGLPKALLAARGILVVPAVGIPNAVVMSSPNPYDGTPWKVVYQDLLLRVAAHYTRDPSLVRAFMDQDDPVRSLSFKIGLTDGDETYAVLLWALLGFDALALGRIQPDLARHLPDNLDEVRVKLERVLPVFTLGIARTREDYIQQRGLQSLYGRRIQWHGEMGEALEHRFLGSVRDLIDVFTVGVCSDGSQMVAGPDLPDPTARTITVSGYSLSEDRGRITELLKGVAGLDSPLSVPLQPTVLWGVS